MHGRLFKRGADTGGFAVRIATEGLTSAEMASVVSLSAGALLANIASVVLLVYETAATRAESTP